MADERDDLTLVVSAETSEAEKGIQDLFDHLKRIGGGINDLKDEIAQLDAQKRRSQEGFSTLQAAIITTGTAVVAGIELWRTFRAVLGKSYEATVGQAVAFGEWTQQLKNASQQLGVTTTFYQAINERAKALNLSQEAVNTGFRTFARVIEVARTQGGQGALVFQQLGVSLDDANGKARSTEAVFSDVTKAIAGMEDGSRKVTLATQLMGKAGAQNIPLLNEIGEAQGNVADGATIMSNRLIGAGLAFDSEATKIKSNVENINRTFGAFMAEGLQPVAHELGQALPEALRLLQGMEPAFVGAVRLMAAPFAGWLDIIERLTRKTNEFLELFSHSEVARQWTAGFSQLEEFAKRTGRTLELFSEGGVMKVKMTTAQGYAEVMKLTDAVTVAQQNLADAQSLTTERTQQLTKAQRDLVRSGQDALEQAKDKAAIEAADRSGGRLAAIQKEAELEKQRLAEQRDRELAALNETEDTEQQRFAIKEKYQALIDASETEHATERIQLETETQTQLTRISVDAATQRAQAAIQQERLIDEERRKAGTLSETDYLAREKDRLDREYDIALAHAERMRDLATRSHDPAQIAEAENAITQVIETNTEKQLALKEKLVAAEEKRLATEREVAKLLVETYGTETQQALYSLATAHDDLVARLKKSGLEEYVDEVGAAYQKLASEAQGVTISFGDAIEHGIEQTFDAVVMGTRGMDDVLKGFAQSIAGTFAKGFAGAIREKLGFDAKFRLNATQEWPAIAAEGAEGIGKTVSSVFDLLGGGSGVGRDVSVSSNGIATFVGGAPSALQRLAPSIFGGGSGQSLNAAVGTGPELGQHFTVNGAQVGQAVGAGSGSSLNLAGLGGLAKTALGGIFLSDALSGNTSGPLGALGPLGAFAGIGGVGAIGSALAGAGGAVGAAGGAVAASSAIPIIGWIIAAIAGAAGAAQTVENINDLPRGAATYTMSALNRRIQLGFAQGALGKSIGKPVGEVAAAIEQLLGNPQATLGKAFGLIHTPTAPEEASRYLQGLVSGKSGDKDFKDRMIQVNTVGGVFAAGTPTDPIPLGPKFDAPKSSRGDLESQRETLVALGLLNVFRSAPGRAARGLFTAGAGESFASQYIIGAEKAGLTTQQFEKQITGLAQTIGSDFPGAITLLNKMFDPAYFAGDGEDPISLMDRYAESVAALAKVLTDAPNAAIEAIEEMARATEKGLDPDKIEDFLARVSDAAQLSQSAIEGAIDALVKAFDTEEERKSNASEQARQDQLAAVLQAQRLRALDAAIQRAKIFGDEVTAATLEMERATILAAQQAPKVAEEILSPGEAFIEVLTEGLRSTILESIVSAVVQGGLVQVALAPVLQAIVDAGKTLADPHATSAEIDAALASISTAANAATPALQQLVGYFDEIGAAIEKSGLLNLDLSLMPAGSDGASADAMTAHVLNAVPHMALGGIVNRPTIALIGESGPEAVIPLSHGRGYGGLTIQNYFSGNVVADDRSMGRLAEKVSEAQLRVLKANRLMG